MDEKNGVLELGELEYHKKWYFPNYFRNSVLDPIISKINANGPFCPKNYTNTLYWVFQPNESSNRFKPHKTTNSGGPTFFFSA